MKQHYSNISRRETLAYLGSAFVATLTIHAGIAQGNFKRVTPTLKLHIKSISNVFEIGQPEPDYKYITNLDDGRGYTVTQYGFCTYNEEVTTVILELITLTPATRLKDFLPYLPPRGTGLDMKALRDFPVNWQHEAETSAELSRACDTVADHLYFYPALQAANTAGIRSPIGKAIFYDTILQHGGGDDPDSFNAIYQNTVKRACNDQACEVSFLNAFLETRRSILNAPNNKETAKIWQVSIPRVDALQNLIKSNPGLIPPIHVLSSSNNVFIY